MGTARAWHAMCESAFKQLLAIPPAPQILNLYLRDYKGIAVTPIKKEHIWRIRVFQNGD